MLVRARAKEPERARFEQWFRRSHLEDVRRIPGIAETHTGRTAGGTTLGFYVFEGAEAVQGALGSAEAAYARGTWQAWAPHLEELAIEIFAPLLPMPIYRSAC
ncbi:MAG: hypothetical protein ACR2HN_03700 [Tepidiformaceae bacterium]